MFDLGNLAIKWISHGQMSSTSLEERDNNICHSKKKNTTIIIPKRG
ncbi:MAG TPA: hypothetical protein VIY08_16635 [Candidatus Nitrosocosmicus sp.]